MQVPPTLWEQWADPCFEWAGCNAPTQPHSRCPKAQALLTALERQGPLEGRGEAPNASAFVKWKSEAKAALILNMKALNHTCAYKARRFKLPTLEGLADLLHAVGGGGRQNLTWRTATGQSTSPPHVTRAIRVGVGNRSFAIVRVPFGWHQAPGLVQHLIATRIAHVDPGGVVVVQYPDDILVVGKQKREVHRVTHDVTSSLSKARGLIGAKTILTPLVEVTWMVKTVNAQAGRIQPRPVAVADCVTRWICLAVAPLTQVSLRRLLGRVVWLGRPGNRAAAFWSGAWAWLHFGPRWAPRTPPNLVGGILEGLCCAVRGWVPAYTQHTYTHAPRLFVDAAQGPGGY